MLLTTNYDIVHSSVENTERDREERKRKREEREKEESLASSLCIEARLLTMKHM
jgi:hypothetical protein